MTRRRTKLLLLGTGASVVGWRVWSRRRTPADEVSFDWSVPPAPEAGIPSTAGEAAESVEPPPAATPLTEPEPPAATAAAEGRAEREAESKDEDTTKFEQRGEREAEERRTAGERPGSEPLQGPDGDTDV